MHADKEKTTNKKKNVERTTQIEKFRFDKNKNSTHFAQTHDALWVGSIKSQNELVSPEEQFSSFIGFDSENGLDIQFCQALSGTLADGGGNECIVTAFPRSLMAFSDMGTGGVTALFTS